MIVSGKGDLLKADVEAMVNTVNLKGVMGKGIAQQFKNAFPANYKAYRNAYEAGELQMGRMFIHQREIVPPKFVINFPTKNHWRNRSQLADVDAGLADLAMQIETLKIHSIALPPLGCGLAFCLDGAANGLIARQRIHSRPSFGTRFGTR